MSRTACASSRRPTAEYQRLLEHRHGANDWKRWGPYLSERSWGTVREDYSADGSAWTFLTHDMARSKAYRWGEDGIGGLSDVQQILCFAPAFWNYHDPILKERLFGLSGPQGNHGEDVKEIYYYLDSTPTHSYMKFLYKYPQARFPYEQLVQVNAARGTFEQEYELIDTGVFEQSRYFDIFIEYAKAAPEEICIRITVCNRASEAAAIRVAPQLWFRNTWAWGPKREKEPSISATHLPRRQEPWMEYVCQHEALGERFFYADCDELHATALFTDNESNRQRLYRVSDERRYLKDAFHERIVHNREETTNPQQRGTKAAVDFRLELPASGTRVLRMVLSNRRMDNPFAGFDQTFATRIAEADDFYNAIHHPLLTAEERSVQRQAFAGMLWNKQLYLLDMRTWLLGDNPAAPPPPQRVHGRNSDWAHLHVADIICMPDKWEYPWFAAWDQAFHVISLVMIDSDLAKRQMELLVSEKLMHANGQVPACEWEFSDVNPPVQAWAVWRVYNEDKHANGEVGDREFLERCYHKLLLNFIWWVNRKDRAGRNVFQGGFLGLDNISVFDRSQPLPNGGHIEQADATGWMALYCLNLMSIGLELAQEDRAYEHLGIKFFEHFISIAAAINTELVAGVKLWNDADGWYYDVAQGLDGSGRGACQIAVRSLVGIIPVFAAQVLEHTWFDKLPAFKERYEWLLMHRPELFSGMMCAWAPDGVRCLLSIVNYDRLRLILKRVLDETEFLSAYGLRSLSKYHREHPYQLAAGGREWTVRYEPGEGATRLFGGNSNWRGPVWFPTAFMLITALRVYDRFYGEGFTIECPTGSGKMMTLNEAAIEIGRRLTSLFLQDSQGKRPIYNSGDLMQSNEHFRDYVLFFEYFHGENGRGLGASHQTGWTGLVAKILDQQAVHRGGGGGKR